MSEDINLNQNQKVVHAMGLSREEGDRLFDRLARLGEIERIHCENRYGPRGEFVCQILFLFLKPGRTLSQAI